MGLGMNLNPAYMMDRPLYSLTLTLASPSLDHHTAAATVLFFPSSHMLSAFLAQGLCTCQFRRLQHSLLVFPWLGPSNTAWPFKPRPGPTSHKLLYHVASVTSYTSLEWPGSVTYLLASCLSSTTMQAPWGRGPCLCLAVTVFPVPRTGSTHQLFVAWKSNKWIQEHLVKTC